MIVLTYALVLRQMGVLPKLLLLIARLGGNVTYVSAAEGRANLAVSAPSAAAHRFAPQLRRIVDVAEVIELRMAEGATGTVPVAVPRAARRRA